MGTGLQSPMLANSYMPEKYIAGEARYPEALGLIEEAFKEQQYWLAVYNRAQQFGLRGFTVQEITVQLQKVSQRLKNLREMLIPWTKTQLGFTTDGTKNLAKHIKDQ